MPGMKTNQTLRYDDAKDFEHDRSIFSGEAENWIETAHEIQALAKNMFERQLQENLENEIAGKLDGEKFRIKNSGRFYPAGKF